MLRFKRDIEEAARSAGYALGLDPNEVRQELWLTLLRKGITEASLAEKGGRLYLFTMAKNLGKNMLRDSRAIVVDLSETQGDEDDALGAVLSKTTDGSMTSPAEDVVQAEAMTIIKEHMVEVLDGVEAKHREVLQAYYIDGLDARDIAQRLTLTWVRAKQRLMNARRALGSAEADLQLWREYSWPDARKVYDGSTAGGTEALRAKLR